MLYGRVSLGNAGRRSHADPKTTMARIGEA
jgi:hypothetical protein